MQPRIRRDAEGNISIVLGMDREENFANSSFLQFKDFFRHKLEIAFEIYNRDIENTKRCQ